MKVPPAKIYFSEEDKREILDKIKDSLSTGQLTLGKNGKEFEKEFAEYVGTRYAVSVNSGTSAIEIPLRILGIKRKDVLVPTNTFFATPAAVIHAGGNVRFVDADPQTFGVNVEGLKRALTPETIGVIAVHIAGIVTPKMKEIKKFCDNNNLFLFEDAAHAHGSTLNGKKAGTFGIAASFSFYPTKVITSGEGGMIATDSEKVRDEAMMYRDQGKAGFTMNISDKLGYNWRMSEAHAAIGLTHFRHLEEFIEERNEIAKIYDEGLAEIPPARALKIPEKCRSNYYKYIALLDRGVDRKALKKELREKYEVGLSGEVYELPCHLQPIFKEGHKEGDFPIAEDICKRHICLPVFTGMTEEQANWVLSSLKEVLKRA